MAVTQLTLYNDALLLIGQRALASTSEARESRYRLDAVYSDIGAINYCLEICEPTFARKSVKLNSPATSSVHDLDNVHTLPADYVSLIGVYSDSKFDIPIERYILETNTIACEFATIYVRYTSNTYALTACNPRCCRTRTT